MKTEVLNMNFTLMDILNFREIDSPLFQRRYSWGIKHKNKDLSNKPVEYFRDFLSNGKKNLFLGTIFIHTKIRYDYKQKDKKDFVAYLSDGQHRLAMSVISLEVVKDIIEENENIKNFASSTLSRKGISDIELYVNKILKKINLKVMKDTLTTENLIDHLRQEKLEVRNLSDNNKILKEKILELNEISKKSSVEQKKKNNESKKNYQKMMSDNEEKIKYIYNNSAVYSSYIRVKEYIDNLEVENCYINMDHEKSLIITDFLERFRDFKLGLIVLHPDQTETNENLDIENEAFLMFNQLNAQAEPLTPIDLFISLLSKKTESEELNDCKNELLKFLDFKEVSLSYFNINKENFIDFVMKISSSEKEHYIFVNKLYSCSEEALIDKFNHVILYFNTMVQFEKSINKNNFCSDYKALFNVYFKNFNSFPILIFLLKVLIKKENINNITKNEYHDFFKVIVVLLIMTTYIPKSGKRPNLARDLNKCNNLKEVFIYIRKHFEVSDNLELKEIIFEHLSNFEFGVSKHRNIGKLLLICEIGESISNDLKEYKDVHYEHIFPQKYKPHKDVESLSEDLKNKYDEFYYNKDRVKYIENLGNATLLYKKINQHFSNITPFEKAEKMKLNSTYKNSCINQNHIDFLCKESENWDEDLILKRGREISNNIVNFIFK